MIFRLFLIVTCFVSDNRAAERRSLMMPNIRQNRSLILSNNYENDSLKWLNIRDMLAPLCPGANLCDTKMPDISRFVNFKDYGSCCTECSCQPDCIDFGNCCFPQEEIFRNKQDSEASNFKRECLHPTTFVLPVETKIRFNSYYMITSVMNEDNSGLACGETSVAFWGSLFPVYSASKQQIYKNRVCADADNVKDGQAWDVLLSCNAESVLHHDDKSIIIVNDDNYFIDFVLRRDFKSKNCHINFMFNDEEIQKLKCFDDVIDDCPNSAMMSTPNVVNFSAEEIMAACTSGFLSPYRQQKMYANVFCHICNGENFQQEGLCQNMRSIHSARGGFTTINIVALIDMDFLLTKRLTSKSTGTSIRKACRGDNVKSCRPVHCPSGHLFDSSGECVLAVRVWYDRYVEIYLNLTVDVDVDVDKLKMSKKVTIKTASQLPKHWSIIFIHFVINPKMPNKTYFHATMEVNKSPLQLKHILKTVHKMLREEWFLHVDNTTHVCSANLNKFGDVPPFISIDRIQIENNTLIVTLPNTIPIVTPKVSGVAKTALTLTQLHLCNQIELTGQEFILSEHNVALFNRVTQRVLFNNEFKLIHDTMKGVRARVCIENSGFFENNTGPIPKKQTVVFVLSIAVFGVLFSSFFQINSRLNV